MASEGGVFAFARLPLVNERLPLLIHFGPKRFEAVRSGFATVKGADLRLISVCVRFCREALLSASYPFAGRGPMSKVTQQRLVAGAMIMLAWGAVSFTTLALTLILIR